MMIRGLHNNRAMHYVRHGLFINIPGQIGIIVKCGNHKDSHISKKYLFLIGNVNYFPIIYNTVNEINYKFE